MIEKFPSVGEKNHPTEEEVRNKIIAVPTLEGLIDALGEWEEVPGSEEGKYWDTQDMIEVLESVMSFNPETLKQTSMHSPLVKMWAKKFTRASGIRDRFLDLLEAKIASL